MTVHDNSVDAFHAEERKLNRREQMVYDWILEHGPHTDREVMEGLGFKEPNSIRPRITALLECHRLMEVCNRVCSVTGRRVRVVDVCRPRISLFSAADGPDVPTASVQINERTTEGVSGVV